MNNKFIYHINSRNRLSGTNSDFIHEIPFPSNSNFNRVAVLQCAIPKSYYNIPASYRTFVLVENLLSANITLDAGNYSRSTLKTALQTELNASSPNGWTYSVNVDSINAVDTGKFYFTCAQGVGQTVSFVFTDSMWEQMGFDRYSTNTFSGTALTSTNVMNLSRENTVRIHSDIFVGTNDDILLMIYSGDSSTFSYITFENIDVNFNSQAFVGVHQKKYRFFITTEDDIGLDTNGININFSLIFFNDHESIANTNAKRLEDLIKLQSALLSPN